jgi:hypothetical protein
MSLKNLIGKIRFTIKNKNLAIPIWKIKLNKVVAYCGHLYQKEAAPFGVASSVSIAYGILSLACGSTEIHRHNRTTWFNVLHRSMGLLKLLHIVLKSHKQTLCVLRGQDHP